jgi:hypothetical protein
MIENYYKKKLSCHELWFLPTDPTTITWVVRYDEPSPILNQSEAYIRHVQGCLGCSSLAYGHSWLPSTKE